MMMLVYALAVMVGAVLIQHLGLAHAIAEVVGKVAACAQCFTFWSTLAALLYLGHDIVLSVIAAVMMAYLSNWFLLLLMHLQRLFSRLYGKEDKKISKERK